MLQLLSAMPKMRRHLHSLLRCYHLYIDWWDWVVDDNYKFHVEIEETPCTTDTHDGRKMKRYIVHVSHVMWEIFQWHKHSSLVEQAFFHLHFPCGPWPLPGQQLPLFAQPRRDMGPQGKHKCRWTNARTESKPYLWQQQSLLAESRGTNTDLSFLGQHIRFIEIRAM